MTYNDPHSGRKSLANNFAHLLSARFFTQFARGIYIVFIARELGPDLYALLAYTQSWYMAFLPLALYGLSDVLSREIGRRRTDAPLIVNQALIVSVVSKACALILCLALGWHLSETREAQVLLVIMAAALLGRSTAMFTNQVFTATEHSRYVLKQEAMFRTVEITTGLIALSLGGGVFTIALIHALSWWAHAWRGLFLLQRLMAFQFTLNRYSEQWKKLAQMAFPFFIVSTSTAWLLHGPIVLFRNASYGIKATGNFALAVQLFILTSILPQALSAAAMPIVSRAAARGDGKDKTFLSIIVRIAFLLGCFSGLVGSAVGPWLIPAVFGSDYESAGTIIGPLLWCMIPLIIVFTVPQMLYARNRHIGAVFSGGAGALTLSTCVIPFTHQLGLIGGVWAIALALCVGATALLVLSAKERLIDIMDDLWRPGAATAISFCVANIDIAAPVFDKPTATILALVVLAMLTIVLRVVQPDEIEVIRRYLNR